MAGGVSMTIDVELGQNRFQLSAQEQFAIDFLGFQKIVGFNVDGVRKKFELGTSSTRKS